MFEEASAYEFLRTHAISGRASTRTVVQLIDDMTENGWTGPPIVVLEHATGRYILDGHHRFLAARLAKILVRYSAVGIDDLPKFGYESIEQVIQAHAEARPNRIRLR
jgi:hypothetical protein